MPSSWEPLPLHRNLSTVGIGPVFLCPPSHYQLPPSSSGMCSDGSDQDGGGKEQHQEQKDQSNESETSTIIKTTWEITGDIKSTPQDFIVREIGWCPPPNLHHHSTAQDDHSKKIESSDRSYMNKYTKRKGWRRGIAGLTDCNSSTQNDGDDDCSEHNDDGDDVSSAMKEKDQVTTREADDLVTEQSEDAKKCTLDDSVPIAKKMKTTLTDDNNCDCVDVAEESMSIALSTSPAAPTLSSACTVDTTQSPDKVLRQVLIQCYDSSTETASCSASDYADNIMKQLSSLQSNALEQLRCTSTETSSFADNEETKTRHKEDESNSLWITTSNLFKDDTNKGSWKLLHENLRKVYPLLKTENASQPPQSLNDETISKDDNRDDDTKKNSKNAWVCAIIDDCFFALIPYLLHPAEDLLQLYTFRSMGPVSSATNEAGSRSNQTNNRKKNRWKKGKKDNRDNNNQRARDQNDRESNEGKVLLHLKPDIPRTDRRNIHQIITGKNNRKSDFETSTRNDVPIHNGNGELENSSSARTTTAIVVQWSRNALQNLQKKRKRDQSNTPSSGDKQRNSTKSNSTTNKTSSSDIKALFCTLKKEHVEHQVALQSLMRALKCRPGDIGLAGIKDMKAITYQFCTLRNVDMKRAQRPILDERISLSDFVPVTNFLLDRGRLIGNQFEITLRNLRQIERLEEDDRPSSWKERAVPVRSSHLDAMVDRVVKHGFINYYGEQRVGDAGEEEYVGVRSFDVGRALLKQNFSLAVDLIMEGRSSNVYNPTQEETNTRQTWKATKDARATLKEFPKSRNVMVRERDLMRGLLRYGDPLEAVKTVPHNTRTFWVHAYQSLVWNKVATERVRRFGIQPVEGDLYFQDNESEASVVTDPKTVNICQVVLPLPGYTIQYPQNAIGDLYREILSADGVQLSVKNDMEESSAKGSYRKLIQHANNLKWENVAQNEEDKSILLPDGVVDAARFTFELDSGCYATMMLRELMLTTMSRGNGKC